MKTGHLSDAARHTAELGEERLSHLRKTLLDAWDQAAENAKNVKVEGRKTDVESRYSLAVDKDLEDIISGYLSDPAKDIKPYVINEHIGPELAKGIEAVTGVNVSGYANVIDKSAIEHIEKRHGINGNTDHSMASVSDVARINYVTENFDKIEATGNESKAWKNRDNTKSKEILIQKKVSDKFYYVVEAVPDTVKKEIHVVSAYINKNDAFQPVGNANSPSLYVRNGLSGNASFSKSTVTQRSENATGSENFSLNMDDDFNSIVKNLNLSFGDDSYNDLFNPFSETYIGDDAFGEDGFGSDEYKAQSDILGEGLAALASTNQSVNQNDIARVAKEIKDQYGNNIPLKDLTGNLTKVFAYAQEHKGEYKKDADKMLRNAQE